MDGLRTVVLVYAPTHDAVAGTPLTAPSEENSVSLPPLVEPADGLTIDEVRRYSRHLIIPDVGMTGQKRL